MKDSQLHPLLSKVLKNYALRADTDFEGALRDALTELKHIADKHKVDFQDRVDAAVEVAKEEDSLAASLPPEAPGDKEFVVDVYELHRSKHSVRATNRGEAIAKFFDGQGTILDNSQEYVEGADRYGKTPEELGFTANEKAFLKDNDINPDEALSGIRGVEEGDE